jgi:integrating conjugative element protein (TIGR03761 family)
MSKTTDETKAGVSAPDQAATAAKRARRSRPHIDPSKVLSVDALAATVPRSVPAPKNAFVTGLKPFPFVTEPNSPFADKYSIAGERAALAEELGMLERDELDFTHPSFERVMELEAREQQYKKVVSEYHQRNGADATVSLVAARSMQSLGALVTGSKETDSMTLHTKEGLRLFMGRAKDPEKKLEAIHGGTRIGSAAKVMWMLTGMDNPYADWALLRLESSLDTITTTLQKETEAGLSLLRSKREQGLNYGVMESEVPKTLELGFKSPYGFAVAEVIVAYDYYIRVIKSLVYRNLRADDDGRAVIRGITRTIRGRFSEFARFERSLTRPECSGLCRADYVLVQTDKASEQAKAAAARIAAVTEIFGPVPGEVFSGAIAPKHSKRRQKLTQHDRAVLDSIARHLEHVEQADPASVNAAVETEAAAML